LKSNPFIFLKDKFGSKFRFGKGSSQASKIHQVKKEKKIYEEKEEGKIEGGALGRLWKKQKSQGQCDFLEPNKSRSERTFRPQNPRGF